MSQKVIFVEVNNVIYDEVLGCVPDKEQVIAICKELVQELHEVQCCSYLVSYEWYEIGDGESDCDEFFPDEELVAHYHSEDIIERMRDLGYDIELIEKGFVEVNADELCE